MTDAIVHEPAPEAAPPPTTDSWLMRWLEAAGDRLNPILVKETRQALKSRQFTLWFVLLLIACWVTTVGAIAIIGPSIYYVSAGSYLLYAYYVILALPLIVVVPFSAYRSLSSEHEENTRDLLEVSSLTPRQVVNGKLGSALLQIVIYCSALAPCIAFTYLLRGVELVMIGLLLSYLVLSSVGLSTVGLVIAAATRQKYAQVVMSVGLAGGLFTSFSGLLALAATMLGLDTNELRGEEFWWGHFAAFSLYVTTLVIAYAAAISLTTFTAANRSTVLRKAAFFQQTVYVAWLGGCVAIGAPREFLFFAFVVAAVYWFAAGALMTGESPSLSQRVRRSLPQSLLGRAVGTWFNPGSGSGYVFAITNLVAVAALAIVASIFFLENGSIPAESAAKAIGLLTAYVAAYLGIGRLAVIGLRRFTEVSLLGCFLIQALFALGGSGLPYVVRTINDRFRLADMAWLGAPSPAWSIGGVIEGTVAPDLEITLLIAVFAVSLAIFIVNLAMAGYEARQLRVATPVRVLQDEQELHPEPEPLATNPWGDQPEPATDPLS